MKLRLLQASLWVTRIFLGGLLLFWFVMGTNLFLAFVRRGSQGIRDYILYAATWDPTFFPEKVDPLLALHSAYQRLIVYILLVWVLKELHSWLRKRTNSSVMVISTEPNRYHANRAQGHPGSQLLRNSLVSSGIYFD